MRPPGRRGAHPGPGRATYSCPRERLPRAEPQSGGSPDPIPNSAVKPRLAESTATPGRGRIGRSARGGRFARHGGARPGICPGRAPRAFPGARAQGRARLPDGPPPRWAVPPFKRSEAGHPPAPPLGRPCPPARLEGRPGALRAWGAHPGGLAAGLPPRARARAVAGPGGKRPSWLMQWISRAVAAVRCARRQLRSIALLTGGIGAAACRRRWLQSGFLTFRGNISLF